jgi:hypothetical protein
MTTSDLKTKIKNTRNVVFVQYTVPRKMDNAQCNTGIINQCKELLKICNMFLSFKLQTFSSTNFYIVMKSLFCPQRASWLK